MAGLSVELQQPTMFWADITLKTLRRLISPTNKNCELLTPLQDKSIAPTIFDSEKGRYVDCKKLYAVGRDTEAILGI